MTDDVSFRTKGTVPGNEPGPDLSAWLHGQDAVLRTWAQLGNGMMKNAFELSQEITTFSLSRLQAGMGAWEGFASCRNPSDLFDRQRQFVEQMTRQYFDEASKVATRMLELARGAQEQTLKP